MSTSPTTARSGRSSSGSPERRCARVRQSDDELAAAGVDAELDDELDAFDAVDDESELDDEDDDSDEPDAELDVPLFFDDRLSVL